MHAPFFQLSRKKVGLPLTPILTSHHIHPVDEPILLCPLQSTPSLYFSRPPPSSTVLGASWSASCVCPWSCSWLAQSSQRGSSKMQGRQSSCCFSSQVSLESQVDIMTCEAPYDHLPAAPPSSSPSPQSPPTPVTGASSLLFNSASGPLHGTVSPGVLFSPRHGLLAQLLQILGLGSSLRALCASSMCCTLLEVFVTRQRGSKSLSVWNGGLNAAN